MKIPEVWKDIPGSEKYQVSNYGNFRKKLKKGGYRPIKTYCRKNKWMAVKCDYKGHYKEYIVHKIVSDVFPEPAEDFNEQYFGKKAFDGITDASSLVLRHKNGLIRDNYAGNLEWISKKELGKKTGGQSRAIPVLQLDVKTGKVINFYKSISAAARDNYINDETICMAIRGQLKTAAGYVWKRETSEDWTEEYCDY